MKDSIDWFLVASAWLMAIASRELKRVGEWKPSMGFLAVAAYPQRAVESQPLTKDAPPEVTDDAVGNRLDDDGWPSLGRRTHLVPSSLI